MFVGVHVCFCAWACMWWESSSETQRENDDYILQHAHDSVLCVFSEPLSGINKWVSKWARAHMISCTSVDSHSSTGTIHSHLLLRFLSVIKTDKHVPFCDRRSQRNHKCVRWKTTTTVSSQSTKLYIFRQMSQTRLLETFCGVCVRVVFLSTSLDFMCCCCGYLNEA